MSSFNLLYSIYLLFDCLLQQEERMAVQDELAVYMHDKESEMNSSHSDPQLECSKRLVITYFLKTLFTHFVLLKNSCDFNCL